MVPFANQSLSVIALQYELALLIGQDLRLVPMLRRFFPPALKLLGCRAAHVWLNSEDTGELAHCFSYPSYDARRLTEQGPLTQAISVHTQDHTSLRTVHLGEAGWGQFLPLRKEGFCLLINSSGQLDQEICIALLPIFERLTTACIACRVHEKTEILRDKASVGEMRLRTVFETVGEVIFQLDSRGRVEFLNPAWTRITGKQVSDCLGKRFTDLIETDDDNTADLLRHILTDTYENFNFEGWTLTLTGESRNLSVQLMRTKNFDGKTTQLIGTMVDTTEQHRLIARLRHARAHAESANQAKSAFLANMSHEIRTPMNGVIGLAQVALNDTREPSTREQLGLILDSAEHLMAVLNDILDFSKIEAGQVSFNESVFDPRAFLVDTVAQIRAQADQKGLALMLDAHENLPRAVRADATRLKQILLNLLNNACKFTSAGSITLRARLDESDAMLFEVQDTGIGVPEDKQEHIFTTFAQADDSIVRSYGGTGLGLSICRRLVELMGGKIGLESKPGEGSRFWFAVSLQIISDIDRRNAIDTSSPEKLATSTDRSQTSKLNVLVVEDNHINRRLMEALLSQMGHNATFAENGELGVALRLQQDFDLVLMDMQMPVMDGLTATRAIREYEARVGATPVPIFALTANAMASDQAACLAAGMDGHLPKPLKRSKLEAVLDEIHRSVEPK